MLIVFPCLCIWAVALAVLLDSCLGEPSRGHPLVIFGRLASRIEQLYWLPEGENTRIRFRGITALLMMLALVLAPVLMVLSWLGSHSVVHTLLASLVIYLCIGHRSLREHGEAVLAPLQQGNIIEARSQLARMVSRDTKDLSESDVSVATCESILENGSDAVFAALFWFLVAGIPGIVLYRAVNTLDAMWGYKNARYVHFGWAAAKLDDLLNWVPARLVAFSYALMGDFLVAMQCWSKQGRHWKSPNAGPVMAAGAGSLHLILGGAALYHGVWQSRPSLGCGQKAEAADIARALMLVNRTLILWLVVIVIVACLLVR